MYDFLKNCVIPKVFPYADIIQPMKLTKSKILEIISRKNKGHTTYQIKKKIDVSIRRINQIYNYYLQNEKPPAIGRRMGRPTRPILKKEKELIKKVYLKYRVSASTLEKVLKQKYNMYIPHNHIHKILIKLDFAKKLKKRHIRRKEWTRYERRHSLTAIHIDWHYNQNKQIWALPVIDDASRKLLTLYEGKSPTTKASILAVKLALKHGKIKQCITDHGSQFYKSMGKSKFATFLEKQGIKHILCRIKHPQSNGKSEKFNDLYKNHRFAFSTPEKFGNWYNDIRPHMSLKFEELETPNQAFLRKMRKL